MADSPTIRLDNLRLKVKVTNYLANSRTTTRKGYFSTHLVTKGYNLQRCNKITQYVTKRYRNNTNLRFRSASLDANQRSTKPASDGCSQQATGCSRKREPETCLDVNAVEGGFREIGTHPLLGFPTTRCSFQTMECWVALYRSHGPQ